MQRKFLTNLAFLLFLNFLVKPFYILGIDAGILERVGAEAYGSYFALISLSFLLNIFLDLGINNFNTRNIAQHTHLLSKHVGGIFALRISLVLLYAVLTGIVAVVLGYSGQQLWLLGVLVLNQALAATVLFMRSNLGGLQLFKQDSLVSVLDRALLIFICGTLLWGNVTDQVFKIEWFVYAQTFAYGATALVATALVLRKAGGLKMKLDRPFSLMILKKSFPYALLILLMTVYYRTDSVMLERMLPDGAEQAGIYAQGFRFFEALNMVAYLFAVLLLPMFAKSIKEKTDVSPLVGLSFKMIMAGALIVAVAGSVYSMPIMEMRYSTHTESSAPAFALLLWCFVSICVTYIFGSLLTANGSLKALNIIAAFGVVLNIVLNLVLIPKYFALGSAMASLITQALTAIAQALLAVKLFKMDLKLRPILAMILFVVGLLALAFISLHHIPNIWLGLITIIGGGTLWAFVTRSLDLKGMLLILRSKEVK